MVISLIMPASFGARGDGVGQFERPDVARVPDFIDILEEFPQRAVEGAVRVGYDADLFHLLVFVAPEFAHAFGDFRFGRVAGVGFVEFGARQRVGQELLLGEVACEAWSGRCAGAAARGGWWCRVRPATSPC